MAGIRQSALVRYNLLVMRMKLPLDLPCVWTLLAAILVAGCATSHPAGGDATVAAPVEPRISGDTVEGIPGARVELPHYVIHSTIPDPAALQRIGQVLEGAHEAYRSLAPEVRLSSYPMECYLFETRPQWAAYTKAHTGDDAAIYLRVNRGGYTINDKFVALIERTGWDPIFLGEDGADVYAVLEKD